MRILKRIVCAYTVCALSGLAAFAQWSAGEAVSIHAGETVNIGSPQPDIASLTNNGTLLLAAGGSVNVTGSAMSVVGSFGAEGVMTVEGSVAFPGADFIVGNQGGTGTLHVASGGVVNVLPNILYVCRNNSGNERDPDTRGFLDIAGTVRATRLELTANFPNTVADEYVDAGVVRLLAGGVLEIANIWKNDRARSYIHFEGGTLRMTASGNLNGVGNGGHVYCVIEDGCEAVFDTGGNNVTFNPAGNNAFLNLTGTGGLRKQGEGALVFRLVDTNNTFSGDIVVEQGSLDLGRPLEAGQQVTLHDGTGFVIWSLADTGSVHVVSGGHALFTVGVDMAGLDLTAQAGYYADRLGGPPSGVTATLSEPLGYDDINSGTALSPFRLIGQGGTLVLTNTGLESAYLQLEGAGRFSFADDRALTNSAMLTLLDSIIYRQEGRFTMAGAPGAPVVFSLAAPNQFETTGAEHALEVGYNGDAEFHATGATMNIERLRIAGGDGVQGSFIQRGGTVTAQAVSWVGYDNGTGRLDVANGNFIVNGDLRIALIDRDPRNMFPDGTVVVSNGTIRCNTLNFTPTWNTTDTALTNRDVGRVHLLDGGVMEINQFVKNDNAISTLHFEGGTLRARGNQAGFVGIGQALATLAWAAPADQSIRLDVQNYTVSVSPQNGKFVLTGDGGFRKLGNGTFGLFAARADYKGDTVVEAGTLRLVGDGLIPSGPGYGNLVLPTAASLLDLNGRAASINKVSGLGTVTNASDGAATLNVLVNGEDETWTRAYVSGGAPITLVKQGEGTLTLQNGNVIQTPVFKVDAGTVRLIAAEEGFPFYRFKVEGVKNLSAVTSMQFSQLALLNGPQNVVPARVGLLWDTTSAPGTDALLSAHPPNESPDKVVNGFLPFDNLTGPNGAAVTNNKWNDFRISRPAEADRVWIRLDFFSNQPLTAYNWATANDTPNRDPADWRLQGSYDGTDWADVDVQSGQSVTGFRNTWVTENGYPVPPMPDPRPVISPDTRVSLLPGGTLEVSGGTPHRITGVSGGGSIALDGTDLILGGAAEPAAFYGTVTGNGNIIIDGDNQRFNALNTATGDFTVRSGTVEITPASGAMHRWFRFTIQDTRVYTNVQQISEFALYTTDDVRCNLNLTQGPSATGLAPGEFWTPAYSIGNNEGPNNLFDDLTGTKWCLSNNFMVPEDPQTWREVTMRLTDGAQEVTSYNMATANDIAQRDPITWKLESSADGIAWQLVDARTDFFPSATRQTWYNSGIPFQFQSNRAISAVGDGLAEAIPGGAIVEVRSGATLAVIGGQQPIGALRVDMAAGAGTITRFTPAPNGTLHLTNTSGAPRTWVIPLTLGSVDTPSVLSTWQVIADGQPLNGYRLTYANGVLSLRPNGMVLMIK
ncbi:MAG: autotransporter-associated beta strand repeat-containing protein [Kiritimatiellaeota bacterium]|nr:autotransporter-associated beta strand repeat-containing protein [Kiritimatiellota bacterium]